MIQKVIKRDGRTVDFNFNKIEDAIRKAMAQTEKGVDAILAATVADKIAKNGDALMSVEAIQDRVEEELMDSERKEVARVYISYRNSRTIARRAKTREVFEEIIGAKKNDITRENANMNADTPAGMMMKFASETTKPFVDDYLLDEDVRLAAQNGYIHIHDKDYYPTKSLTCVQHPLNTLHLTRNSTERNARWTGHPRSRFLFRSLRTPHLSRGDPQPGELRGQGPEPSDEC